MSKDLDRNRRLLVLTYCRYVDAEIGWVRARNAARRWFPESSRPYRWTMGSPHSPLRRIYEERQRALVQLAAARRKFRQAKARMARRDTVIDLESGPLDGNGT